MDKQKILSILINLKDKNPELKNIFNTAHQATGTQPAALAHAVWAYANYIDNLDMLSDAVTRIGHKHASLGVKPEHYKIVGDNLLASIGEVLGSAVTPDIVEAWTAAYAQLAEIFINFESNLYKQATNTPGGWNGWRKFKVAKKVRESEEIISFYLEPTDKDTLLKAGKKILPPFHPGQYVSIRYYLPELNYFQPRQYSLSDTPNGQQFRISVKREYAMSSPEGKRKPPGVVSNVLHENLPEGAEIEISFPYGDFTLDIHADTPVVLISGGVGLTPMVSMLNTVVEMNNLKCSNNPSFSPRKVVFIHAVRNGRVHAMRDFVNEVASKNKNAVSKLVYYEDVDQSKDIKGLDYDHEGRVDLSKIKEQVLLPEAHYYVCGPGAFMNAIKQQLKDLGVSSDHVHSEVFGSTIA
jgi:nitric oxide dioxygenase